jgi:hypothetical protein
VHEWEALSTDQSTSITSQPSFKAQSIRHKTSSTEHRLCTLLWTACRSDIPTPYAHALFRPPSSPTSFVSPQPRTFVGLSCPDHVTSQGRDSARALHRDNDAHTPPSRRPSSVVVTTDPADVSTTVVTPAHREVQHTTVLCHLYKNDAFRPIPTASCVLAFIANNKGTLNPPAFAVCFSKISLSLSLSRLLFRSFATDLRCLA